MATSLKRVLPAVLAVVVLLLVIRRDARGTAPEATAISTPASPTERAPSAGPEIGKQKTIVRRYFEEATGTLRLEGQVIDEREQPIGGALVTLGLRSAVTEADGSFAFDALAAGEYKVTAEHAGYFGEETTTLSDDTDPVVIKAERGATLVVTVQDATTLAPIAGAAVTTYKRSAVTDATGHARLRSIDAGYERIQVTASGYASQRTSIVSDDPEETVEHTIRLEHGAPVSGEVVGADGRPIADARVHLTAAGGTWTESVSTDEAGRWSIEALGRGTHGVSARAEGYLASEEQPFVHDGTAPSHVVVRLELGGEVSGIVVDGQGKPVADARVSGGSSSEYSDATGHFVLRGMPEGDLEVFAVDATAISRTAIVKLTRGGRGDVRLVMMKSSIAGIVVDAAGIPVPDALVGALDTNGLSQLAHTDDFGKFDFGGIVPGTYRITAQRAEETRHDFPPGVEVKTGDRRVRIVVEDSSSIAGRVVLDGKPVPLYGYAIGPSAEDARDPSVARTTDGRFVEHAVPPGTWTVVFAGPGFARHVVEHVVVSAGSRVDLGDVAVSRGRTLTGRVTDVHGAAVARATVRVYERGTSDASLLHRRMRGEAEATTDSRGEYRIDGLLPTELHAHVTHPTLGMSLERELAADQTVADFAVTPTGSVDGTVKPAAGRPTYAHASRVGDGWNVLADVDRTGAFRFDRLPVGTYDIVVGPGSHEQPVRVTVEAGQRVTVEL